MIDKILGFRESFVWKALRNLQRFLLTFTSCAMTLIICVVVFIRYFLHGDLFGYEEINIVLCMWFYFIGASYSALDKKLISADMTSLFLNPAQRRIVDLVVKALTAILSIVMAVWGYNYFVWGLGHGWCQLSAENSSHSVPKRHVFRVSSHRFLFGDLFYRRSYTLNHQKRACQAGNGG